MNILISGGGGLLANELEKTNNEHTLTSLIRSEMDTASYYSILTELLVRKPDIFIHCGAMTAPMVEHETMPNLSIMQNIIGTANVATCCYNQGVKPVYISTDYVYKGDYNSNGYSETDPVKPINNYGWSKLGGECSMMLIPNSLILRCSFTARPFKHKKAFNDSYKSFLYVDEIAPIIWKLIDKDCTGIYNVGGKTQSIYNFAKMSNSNVIPISRKSIEEYVPVDTSLNINKTKGVIE